MDNRKYEKPQARVVEFGEGDMAVLVSDSPVGSEAEVGDWDDGGSFDFNFS